MSAYANVQAVKTCLVSPGKIPQWVRAGVEGDGIAKILLAFYTDVKIDSILGMHLRTYVRMYLCIYVCS